MNYSDNETKNNLYKKSNSSTTNEQKLLNEKSDNEIDCFIYTCRFKNYDDRTFEKNTYDSSCKKLNFFDTFKLKSNVDYTNLEKRGNDSTKIFGANLTPNFTKSVTSLNLSSNKITFLRKSLQKS